MNKWTKRNVFWSAILTILGIVCFPANPLVFAGVVKTESYFLLFIIGWITWAFGMSLVMAPIIMFPRHGGIPSGKSFVNTTRLVNTGIYSIVRHPQYVGGIFAIFLTTLLWYPHWLFALLALIGAVVIYASAREEEQRLIDQFGNEYVQYMQKVPGMNLIVGAIRFVKQKRNKNVV
ncbi:isoprenylcysteine carboxylmethyltransferase family protein [bacterium]|nr:isoprenylcysteine carboxylmethyltransferase family protein [bacterium]